MKENEIKTKWISIRSYDALRVVLGILILSATSFVYITSYYGFEGKDNLGFFLSVMLIVGIALLANGMDDWRKRDKKLQKVEDIENKVRIAKDKKELENLKK